MFSSQPAVPRAATRPNANYENSFYRENRPASIDRDPAYFHTAPPTGLQQQYQPYEESAIMRSMPGWSCPLMAPLCCDRGWC